MPAKVTVSPVIDTFLRAADADGARTAIGLGSPTYVDGEVATYNDLPTSVAVAPVDSAYLVRQSSGVWLINYKPSGLYIRTGSGGVLADWTYAGVFPDVFRSNNFRVLDSADATKALAFDVSGVATGTTRTLTVPDASGTIMLGSLNLASLTNTATARTNLGLGALSMTDGTLNVAGPSLTGTQAFGAVAISQTWNTTGTPTALDINVTDTASNAASLLLNLRTGGASRFSVSKGGAVTATDRFEVPGGLFIYSPSTNRGGIGRFGALSLFFAPGSVSINTSAHADGFGWGPTTSPDLFLNRDAANTLAQRNGTNAQALRLYGTFTDASNHRRLAITSTTGGLFTLSAEGAGTGASGNILALSAPVLVPAASVSLGTNGHLAFEATSNTSLTIRYRGSDGTTRSVALTLS